MLMPKKVKYRKLQKGRMKGKSKRGSKISFGDFAIQALECGWITNQQIEAARIAMTRSAKRGANVWIRIFPHKSLTQKPAETRMGSGKGNPEHWVAVIKPGRVLFEISGVNKETARAALKLAAYKLPVRTKFVAKDELVTTTTNVENTVNQANN